MMDRKISYRIESITKGVSIPSTYLYAKISYRIESLFYLLCLLMLFQDPEDLL